MKECLQFLIEPAKKLKIRLKVRVYCSPMPGQYVLAPKYTSSHFFFSFLSSVSLLQESRKRVKLEKKEPLVESQLFIMELARELNKICQVSSPPLSFLSVADKHTSTVYLIYIINTLEVKHPRPHLDH